MMCPPCQRAQRRRGRHRAHPACTGGGVAGAIGYVCDCRCRALPSWWTPPTMVLPALPPRWPTVIVPLQVDCGHQMTLLLNHSGVGAPSIEELNGPRLCLHCGARFGDRNEA